MLVRKKTLRSGFMKQIDQPKSLWFTLRVLIFISESLTSIKISQFGSNKTVDACIYQTAMAGRLGDKFTVCTPVLHPLMIDHTAGVLQLSVASSEGSSGPRIFINLCRCSKR